ncbi:tetratricopeptide repeat protein [Alcanivorax sp. DP30]|uniref:tetratricopeptide repeat protein n=1 Tax=Alcanivorax sp. DP30 TaxID=2606217 RepID=UPI0013687449
MARFFVALFSLLAGLASAAPYTPNSDDQILVRLSPAEQALGQPASAGSEANAIRQAREYIDYARQREDSRFLGYARAILSPWLGSPSSPPIALLMAEIEQRQHQFAQAQTRLTKLLERHPNDGQAWLMLANLHRVQGRFEDARHACRQGASTLPPTTVVICQSSIQAMTGQLPKAWQTLQRLADSGLASPGNEQRWLHTLLAEMAIQQGLYDQANNYLNAALQDAPQPPYLVYLQNDLRLMRGDNDKVIAALQPWQDRENALLRLAIAAQRSHHPDADRWQQAYQDLLNAAQQSGRDIHLREQARFQLQVSARPEAALQTAQANWETQREISDLRILLASAAASGDQDAHQQAMQFIDLHGISDAPSQPLQDASP